MVGAWHTLKICVCVFLFAHITDVSGVLSCLETITEPADIHEANHLMPKLIEFGMMNDHPLMTLGGLFNHVSD